MNKHTHKARTDTLRTATDVPLVADVPPVAGIPPVADVSPVAVD